MKCSETETAGPSESRKVIFFDTNFFRALLKGDFENQRGNPCSDLHKSLRPPFTPWRTPFSFMEWIGLKSKSLPKPSPFDLASASHEPNFIEPAYRHYKGHYESVRELDRDNLETRANTQRSCFRPSLQALWDAALARIFEREDVSGWLRFALCFDAVHKLDGLGNHRKNYWSELMAHGFFNAGDYRIRNLSKFRLAYRLWMRYVNAQASSGASQEVRDEIEITHDLLKIGNWKDYLDGDLVHVASYGVETSDGTRHRVISLTCDAPDVVIMRIRLYKGLLSFVHKIYRNEADAEGFPPDFESSHNGEVHCFDCYGNLVRRIDVTNVTPPLPFLGNTPP
jgi:hypothetical protein